MCFSRLLAVPLVLAGAIALPDAAGAAGIFGPPAGVRAPLPAITLHPGLRPSTSITYKIVDDGAPSPSAYVLEAPTGLNDTRQIVGAAYIPGGSYQHCLVWTGKAFVDLESPKSLSCYPSVGISSANAAGDFSVVGETSISISQQTVAFYANLTPTAVKPPFNLFANNVPSALYAMNASGYAVGYSWYNPYGGFASTEPAFATVGAHLLPVQPHCVTAAATCLNYPLYQTSYSGQSRSVNAAGTVLAAQTISATAAYAETNVAHPALNRTFNLPFQGANQPGVPMGLDDSGRVYYLGENATDTAELVYRFDPVRNVAVNLGNFKGDTCTFDRINGLNGTGELLVYATNCKNTANDGWATYDSVHGFSSLSGGIPGNSFTSITPEWINDRGDVLVQLGTQAGITHWGILEQK